MIEIESAREWRWSSNDPKKRLPGIWAKNRGLRGRTGSSLTIYGKQQVKKTRTQVSAQELSCVKLWPAKR